MKILKENNKGLNHKLYQFIDILRDASIFISTDELLSLFTAIEKIPFDNKTVFKQTLQTTLVKDNSNIPVFSRCFDNFFLNNDNIIDKLSNLNEISEAFSNEELEIISKEFENFINSLSSEELFEKEKEDLLKLFIEEIIQDGSSMEGESSLFSRKKTNAGMTNEIIQDGISKEQNDEIYENLKPLADLIIQKRKIGLQETNQENALTNKPIYQLTHEEIAKMREIINRFGQKLKSRVSPRKKRTKHGSIDIKRTLRKSMPFDGIPFNIYKHNKKIAKPELVVLCDVSGSVNQYTRFMLLLTHTMQSLFAKVRTFAFISNMVEITPLFMEMDPEIAINSIFTDTDFTYGWGSNYGGSLDQFIENYSDSLNKKTTVLILGDCRNNSNDAGLESLQKIKDQSRVIFWLNPEKRHLWDWADSIATTYMHYAKHMKEINSFTDLTDFVEILFPNFSN